MEQSIGQVVCDHACTEAAGRSAMEPCTRASSFEPAHTLGQQTADNPGQHVPTPGRAKPRWRVCIDGRAPIGSGDNRVGAFEQHNGTGHFRGLPGSRKFVAGQGSEHAAEFPFVPVSYTHLTLPTT